ncbi:iron-containing alcohol dehydrogenase [Candidatus Latescibacterota bacterium]
MLNFSYYCPVNIVFGKGSISELTGLIATDEKVLITYGGGSIMKNGVFDQVSEALKGHEVLSFGGIEPNPDYSTLIKAVEIARNEEVGFLLSVGGGSVLDGTKFIAAAIPFEAGKEWDILEKKAPLESAVPLGAVLTLPATGSEMNTNSVVSRRETGQKLVFSNALVYPRFSILDPETTYSLPERQTANGIVDSWVHVLEQYLTYPVNSPLQDRQAEAIMLTLLEEAPKVLKKPKDYDARANVMWCATHALNGIIGRGVPGDWATHIIGHELTALYGIDHARTLAVVLPAMMKYRREQKKEKLLQYAERIWGITDGDDLERIDRAIEHTCIFFESLGVPTSFSSYGTGGRGLDTVVKNIGSRGMKISERSDMGEQEIGEVLNTMS